MHIIYDIVGFVLVIASIIFVINSRMEPDGPESMYPDDSEPFNDYEHWGTQSDRQYPYDTTDYDSFTALMRSH